jgi:hypothetical protein
MDPERSGGFAGRDHLLTATDLCDQCQGPVVRGAVRSRRVCVRRSWRARLEGVTGGFRASTEFAHWRLRMARQRSDLTLDLLTRLLRPSRPSRPRPPPTATRNRAGAGIAVDRKIEEARQRRGGPFLPSQPLDG